MFVEFDGLHLRHLRGGFGAFARFERLAPDVPDAQDKNPLRGHQPEVFRPDVPGQQRGVFVQANTRAGL